MLMPKTNAYYEIWLDEEKIADKNLKKIHCTRTGTCRVNSK